MSDLEILDVRGLHRVVVRWTSLKWRRLADGTEYLQGQRFSRLYKSELGEFRLISDEGDVVVTGKVGVCFNAYVVNEVSGRLEYIRWLPTRAAAKAYCKVLEDKRDHHARRKTGLEHLTKFYFPESLNDLIEAKGLSPHEGDDVIIFRG